MVPELVRNEYIFGSDSNTSIHITILRDGYIVSSHAVAILGVDPLNVTKVFVDGVTADFLLRTVFVFLYDLDTLRGRTFLGTCLGVAEKRALSGLNCGFRSRSKYLLRSR